MFIYEQPEQKLFDFFIKSTDYPIPHMHKNYWEFAFVFNAPIIHTINGRPRKINPNTLLVLRPDDIHSIRNETEKQSNHSNLTVLEDYFKQVLDLLMPGSYEILKGIPYIEIPCSPARADYILQKANNLLTLDKSDPIYSNSIVLFFMQMLQETFSVLTEKSDTVINYSRGVSALLQLINNPENLSMPLRKLIAQTNYSYSHMNKLFLNEIGITPNTYFKNKKFEYAKILLTDSNMNLTQIATAIGYDSYPPFSYAFKKKFGFPPSQYVLKYKKD